MTASPIKKANYTALFISCMYFLVQSTLVFALQEDSEQELPTEQLSQDVEQNEVFDDDATIIQQRRIHDIIVEGNHHVSTEAIFNKIPYHKGEVFSPLKSRALINNVMQLGYFKNVQLFGKSMGNDGLDLYVVVTEKKLLKEVIFKGNKHLTEKEITAKIPFADIPAMDESDLMKYCIAIKKLYRDKDYHQATVNAVLEDHDEKVTAVFTIDEHKKTAVRRVFFEGNKAFDSKKLRGIIFTREDWAFGFLDRAGSYQPEAIESDKHVLENFYQSNGYLNAKVTKVDIVPDEDPHYVQVTFHIDEGDLYTLSSITVQGNESVSEEQILVRLSIAVGDLYSKDKIRQAIETIRLILGEFGYIYADVEPSIEPDDENKTVSLSFFTELGDKVFLERIKIIGNEKTRDKVIRRQLLFDEGDLLTTQKLEDSKTRVENLGFFDQQGGVSWKYDRTTKDTADLKLYVKEVKTGRLDAQVGFGGSPKDLQNPTESLRVGGSLSDTNLFGLGIGFNLSGEISKQERQLLFNITEPWLFDRPIYAAFDLAFKKSVYDDFRLTKDEVKEQLASGSLSLGFVAASLNQTRFVCQAGYEGLHYKKQPIADLGANADPKEQVEFQRILDKRFPQGNFPWIGGQAAQDFRNHPLHPSRGYQWQTTTRIGIPNDAFGFWKFDFDASYYTPIIGERDLVFYLHSHFGWVTAFMDRTIPFRELYHIGGPSSVRGFLFGEIGPTFKGVDSIGGKKAFWLNAELIFPVAPDFSIKGVFFYDGGAGWDTPDADQIAKKRLKNNHFSYRHAVGFGVRIYRPTPIRIDWGFKLDRRKGEKASEVHLSSSYDF